MKYMLIIWITYFMLLVSSTVLTHGMKLPGTEKKVVEFVWEEGLIIISKK